MTVVILTQKNCDWISLLTEGFLERKFLLTQVKVDAASFG
jgi:hypothetical protein